MMSLHDIFGAVTVDEVGIFAARLGPLLLKTAYQPVFSLMGERLELAAMSGGVQPLLAGQPIRNGFIELMPLEESQRGADIGLALAMLNRVNVDAEGLPMFVHTGDADGSSAAVLPALLEQLDRHLQGRDAMPGRLICELPRHDSATLAELARFAADCRSRGFDISLSRFSGTVANIEAVRAIRPEIVSVDIAWYHAVAAAPPAARLLPPLFESIRDAGCKVHVGGIEDAAELAIATGAGADYLQGDYLAPPALAGTLIDGKSLPQSARAGADANVVPLFG